MRNVLAATTLAVALAGAATLVRPSSAEAMTILRVDLPTLVKASELVLEGQVGGVRVIDRRKEGRSVWTEYTLDVSEVFAIIASGQIKHQVLVLGVVSSPLAELCRAVIPG